MKRIELIGLPGAGKSTLLKEMRRRRRSTSPWVFESDLDSRFPKFMKQIFGLIANKRLYNDVGSRGGYHKRKYWDVDPENERFLDISWKLLIKTNNTNTHRAFVNAHYFWTTFVRTNRVMERRDIRWCIMDEGLVHRIYAVVKEDYYRNEKCRILDSDIELYIEQLPAPEGVIHVDIPPEIAAQRIRKRLNEMTLKRSEEEKIMQLNTGAKIEKRRTFTTLHYLERRGIPVLRLDGRRPIEELADKTITAIGTGFFPVERGQ